MSTTTRSVTAALLALPLLVGVTAPATAAPPEKEKMSGSWAVGGGTVVGVLPGLPGNVHSVSVYADGFADGVNSSGELVSWSCPEGVTEPWSEDGPAPCGDEPVAYYELNGTAVSFAMDQKMSAASLSGTFSGNDYSGCWEEEWCEPDPVGPLDVQMQFTAVSRIMTERYKESFRDPETGFSYRYMATHRMRDAAVTGTLEGIGLVDTHGTLATYKVRSMIKE